MTQLIQRLDATNPVAGWIDGTDAPTLIKDGIPYDRGALALDISSAISYYHMGLPFTANGRLAASIDVAVARIGNGAAPFTAANRLAFSQNAAVSYIAAVGFTADSMISLTASEFNSTAIFKLLLQNTLVPELATGSATPSFTRATTASVPDFEGKVNTALSGESRFKGARRVENLIAGSSEDFGNAAWKVGGGASKVGAVTVEGIDAWEISFSANADELFQSSQAVYNDKTLVESVWLRAKTGTVDVSLDMDASGNTLTLDTTWRRYSTLETVTGGTQPSVVAKESGSIYIAKFMVENVTGQSNQNPSEYVSSGVGTGAELWTDPNTENVAAYTSQSTLAIVGGKLRITQLAAGNERTNNAVAIPTVVGKSYVIAFGVDATDLTGTPLIRVGISAGNASYLNGVYAAGEEHEISVAFVATTTTAYFSIYTGAGSVNGEYLDVSNITAKEASHGANVDSVQYFNTLNGNTVSSNVVTEATGALIGASNSYADANGPFGYMAEAASTNICLQSNDFSTSWQNANSVDTQNQGTFIDGTNSFNKITDNSAGGTGVVQQYQLLTISSAVSTTYSVYCKADQVGYVYLEPFAFDTSAGGKTWFNLITGAIGTTSANHTANIEPLPNGVYRCAVTFQSTTDVNGGVIIGVAEADNQSTVDLDGTSSILAGGAQVEVGSYPTSYIPTTTAAVTRNADALIYVGAGNIEDPAGTAYAEVSADWAAASDNRFVLERSNGFILFRSVGESPTAIKSYDGGNPASFSPTGTSYYKATQAIASTWGAALTAYSPATLLPDLTPSNYDGTIGANNIGVGVRNSGATQWSGTIRNLQIYSTELTAAEVQDI